MRNIPLLAASVMMLLACDSDLETVTYNDETAVPASIEALPAEIDLQTTETFHLTWTAPELGYDAEVTNTIEMDLTGKGFAENKVTLTSVKGGKEYAVDAATFNSRVMSLLEAYDMEVGKVRLDLRIVSSISEAAEPLYSNVVTTDVTPYTTEREYPKIWVIGDYCGWSHDNSQFLYSFSDDDEYQGIVDFEDKAANGFKITGVAGWDDPYNWGTDGSSQTAESPVIQLISGSSSANIECYGSRFYHFTFNTSTLGLVRDWAFGTLSVVGDAGSQISGWGGSELDMTFNKATQCFEADVQLADGEIKFRTDHDWALCFGYAGDGSLTTDPTAGNIQVTAGDYHITVNLNNASGMTYVLTAK